MKTEILKNCTLTLCGTILLLTSCEKTDDEPNITADNLKGMFVACEGDYGKANGDITFFDSKLNQSAKSLYNAVNNVALGDVVESFEIVDTLGFIVVNNSQKVTVVDMRDFTLIKTIDGFSYPRSVVRANGNTVYVSNGNGYSDNYIYSIDLSTLSKSDSLEVTSGPEKLLAVNSKVYAAIAGGWKNDGKTVVEIDPVSFTIVNTYEVASVPIDIINDKNNNIWAYCKGVASYDENWNASYSNSGISLINVSTKAVSTFPLTSMSASGINNIAASNDGSLIYYLNDGLYSMSVTDTDLPATKLVNNMFYGVDVDPNNGYIVCLNAADSKAVVYNPDGVEQYSFETGNFPTSVVFSY
ncbi:MAG: hypothetical protein LLG13_17160 [Bacteroidales bacterium]|nr:hypothetical protein [Bacteroidales bacterium]